MTLAILEMGDSPFVSQSIVSFSGTLFMLYRFINVILRLPLYYGSLVFVFLFVFVTPKSQVHDIAHL